MRPLHSAPAAAPPAAGDNSLNTAAYLGFTSTFSSPFFGYGFDSWSSTASFSELPSLDELLELEEQLVEEDELDEGLKSSPESIPEKSSVGDLCCCSTGEFSSSIIALLAGKFGVGKTKLLPSCLVLEGGTEDSSGSSLVMSVVRRVTDTSHVYEVFPARQYFI
ncbi:unnamed protein product [Arctia plantaginis]|uniref:Uncharacterized protein n=1 Tax=Arctia plantaginis TaxID=874455 RepID=A0A8S1B4G4_ARCPL|nr:unnamed protein product [Arctia plantaginis]